MKYKATLDTSAKVLTALTIVLFGLVIYKVGDDLRTELNADGDILLLSLAIGSLVFTVLFCFLFMPSGYMIEHGKLIIVRPLIKARISLSDIESIESADKKRLSGTIRTFGVGGLFGYFGRFYNTRIGKMTFYATRREDGILLKMKNGRYIFITPDDRETFIKDLEEAKKFS